jgi:predicted  nucleic acid-binding Zn-ribbon protein
MANKDFEIQNLEWINEDLKRSLKDRNEAYQSLLFHNNELKDYIEYLQKRNEELHMRIWKLENKIKKMESITE